MDDDVFGFYEVCIRYLFLIVDIVDEGNILGVLRVFIVICDKVM